MDIAQTSRIIASSTMWCHWAFRKGWYFSCKCELSIYISNPIFHSKNNNWIVYCIRQPPTMIISMFALTTNWRWMNTYFLETLYIRSWHENVCDVVSCCTKCSKCVAGSVQANSTIVRVDEQWSQRNKRYCRLHTTTKRNTLSNASWLAEYKSSVNKTDHVLSQGIFWTFPAEKKSCDVYC